MLLKALVCGKQALYDVFNEALRIHFGVREVCLINLLFPSFSLSAAQNTGISTLYRNSYGAPAEDIKHNQVSTETKMLLLQMAKDRCNIVCGNGRKTPLIEKDHK